MFIEELAVSDPHRGKGFGRNLILHTLSRLADQFPGSVSVVLDVDRMAIPAVNLYRELEFQPLSFYTVGRSP